jgi:hypothetical protein
LAAAVKILGGYSDDFSKRDPWGAHRTILTGLDVYGGSTDSRLIVDCRKRGPKPLVIDGLIIDNGPRNHFKTEKNLLILRKANGGKNKNASPERGAIRVKGGQCLVSITNNVLMNTAPTAGVIQIWSSKNGKVSIRNNLIINNTGEGVYAMTSFHGRSAQGLPEYEIHNNTFLFHWKHDAIATYGGNAIKLDSSVKLKATNNVFGFGDYGGVDNIKKSKWVKLANNLFFGNKLYDYREYNTAMKVDDIEDESDILGEDSEGNLSKMVKVKVGKRFATIYASLIPVSRHAVDAAAKVKNTGANQLRGILGLPLQAGAVKMDANIWLPRLMIDEALAAGSAQFLGKYGCKKP